MTICDLSTRLVGKDGGDQIASGLPDADSSSAAVTNWAAMTPTDWVAPPMHVDRTSQSPIWIVAEETNALFQ